MKPCVRVRAAEQGELKAAAKTKKPPPTKADDDGLDDPIPFA